jgi:hypothetical protein
MIIYILTDLHKALLGNCSINMFQSEKNGNYVSVDECYSSLLGSSQHANGLVFSVWSVRSVYNEDLL